MKKFLAVGVGVFMVVGITGIAWPAFADHDPFGGVPQTKITVCHATGSTSNPYENVDVSISSSGAPQGGHDSHTNDIIPPYHWTDGDGNVQSYPGSNWTPENEIIWNSGGCDGSPTIPTPTDSPTPTPTGSPTPTPASLPEIHGMKFEDLNGDGTWDVGEPGIENWVINLYDTGMVWLASTSTDLNGAYAFMDLDVGTYNVRETQMSGWTQTTTNPGPLPVDLGDLVMNINFGNFENVSISGFKQNLAGANLAGWTIFIDENANMMLDVGESWMVTTSSLGYAFDDMGPGTYSLCEVIQSGWRPSSTLCQDVVVDESGVDMTSVNFANIQDQEGTQGFWRNWSRHKKYSEASINTWLTTIDGASVRLMPTGYTANTAGMVKLIGDSTKQCNKNAGSYDCARLKFSAQYLVTRLDVISGKKNLITWYAVPANAQTLLGLDAMEQLGDIINATELLVGPLTREQYLTLANLFDTINNTGY